MKNSSIEDIIKSDIFKQHFDTKTFFSLKSDSSTSFSYLAPWENLNQLLESHRLEFPRIRLWKNGKMLDASSFMKKEKLRESTDKLTKNLYHTHRLDTLKLNQALREGASLVISSVDEVFPPVRDVAQALEGFFKTNVIANAYLSLEHSPAFKPHWDDHDVLIFQVHGKKKWWISPNTNFKYPMPGDLSTTFNPPENFEWEKLLQPGDFLYIPRGYWHYASALGDPSLHITFGVSSNTGLHFLDWMKKRLQNESELFRQDIPRAANSKALKEYYANIKEYLDYFLQKKPLLEEYLKEFEKKTPARPSASLPWSIKKENFSKTKYCYKWSSNLVTDYQKVFDKKIRFYTNGKSWTFPISYDNVIRRLLDRKDHTYSSLENIKTKKGEKLDKILLELAEKGLVKIKSDS